VHAKQRQPIVLPQFLLLGLLVGVQHSQLSFTPAAAAAATVASRMMTIGCIDCQAWEGSCLLQTLTLSIDFPRFNFQKN
jgi:hypothetical protein